MLTRNVFFHQSGSSQVLSECLRRARCFSCRIILFGHRFVTAYDQHNTGNARADDGPHGRRRVTLTLSQS